MRRIFFVALALFCTQLDSANAQRYFGELVWKPLSDGRKMEVVKDFGFEDDMKRKWQVPKGWVIDGASIPKALWTFFGAPYSGKYREASVIHDYFCDVKRRPWKQVHRVFNDAIRASGVSKLKSKIMYLAVYRFGPRWDFSVPTCPPGFRCAVSRLIQIKEFTPEFSMKEFELMRASVEANVDVPLREVERKLDRKFVLGEQ